MAEKELKFHKKKGMEEAKMKNKAALILKEHPVLEALLWFTPLLGELRDIKEINQNGRKNLYYDPSTPNISPGEFAFNDFLTRELIRYGILGYAALFSFGAYAFVTESMEKGVVKTLYEALTMGL